MASIVEIIIKAADQTKSGFTSANKNLTDVEKNLARIAPAAKAAAVAAAAAVAVMVKQSIDMADEMSKAAQKIGLTTEGLSKLKYAAEDLSGVQGFASAMAKMNRTLVEGATLGGRYADAFKKAGVAMRDASGNIRQSESVLMDVADAIAAMPDSAEKTALAMELFGKSGADLIPFLNGGSEAIREMTDEAKALGLEISSKTGKEAEAFNDNLTRIQSAGRGFANMVAAEFLPILVSLSNEMVESVKQGGLMRGMFEGVSFVVKVLGSGLISVVTAIREAILGISNLAALITTFALEGREAAGKLAESMADEFEKRRQATLIALANLWQPEGADVTPEKAGRQAGIDYVAGAVESIQKEQAKLVGVIVSGFQTSAGATKAISEAMTKEAAVALDQQRISLEEFHATKIALAKKSAEAELAALEIATQAEERKLAGLEAGTPEYEAQAEAIRKAVFAEGIARRTMITDVMVMENERDKAIEARNKKASEDAAKAAEDELNQEVQRDERARQRSEEQRQVAAELQIEKLDGWAQEMAIEEENHQRRLAQIDELGLAEDEYYAAREAAAAGHAKRVEDIKNREKNAEKQVNSQRIGAVQGMFGMMADAAFAFGKKGFAAYKAFAIAETIISTYSSAVKAYDSLAGIPFVGPALGAAAAAAAIAFGIARVGQIKSAQPAGQAHAGMDYVPSEGSYVLQRGEMVLDPGTSESVRQAARSATGAQAGGNSGEGSGGSGGFMADVYLDGQKVGRALMKLAQNGQLTLPKMAIV